MDLTAIHFHTAAELQALDAEHLNAEVSSANDALRTIGEYREQIRAEVDRRIAAEREKLIARQQGEIVQSAFRGAAPLTVAALRDFHAEQTVKGA